MTESEQRFATRLNSFRSRNGSTLSAEQAVRAVAEVPGISAVELNYPQHFTGDGNRSVLAAAGEVGLAVTALNLRWDGPDFVHGAFTHPKPENRGRAIRQACEAVDMAAQNNVDHVILWMGPDGYDYPFQANYRAMWEMEIDGFRQVASHNKELRVSVEYKPVIRAGPRLYVRCRIHCWQSMMSASPILA